MEIERFFLHDFKIDNNVEKKDGGEATVSKAWHPRFGEVAIKEWAKPLDNINNEIALVIKVKNSLDRIKEMTWYCNHPNIIQFVGMLVDNESSYIGYIMPYMSLGSLHDVIHNGAKKYGEKQVSSWITQICFGLSHLHFKNIVHGDVKPSNVLLGKCYDDVKLSDFGMTKSLNDISHTFTRLGTPLYMAPEIMKGGKYNFSADIYSLSITIWEILHRRIPYDHITLQFDLLSKISNGERPKLNDNLSKEVSDLLMRCWQGDASKRPTINHVAEFFNKTKLLYTGLKNVVNEPVTSLENLNVHKSNESLLPIPLSKPIEKNLKQTILLLGGTDKDSLLLLENNKQNWKKLNIKLPYAMHGHGPQFLNNNLYIFGGNSESSTYKLSKSLQWEKMANMNEKRERISNSNVILKNQIWVCGGWNGKEILKIVEVYNPETKKWKYVADMNKSRSNAAAAVVNGKIFCSGGVHKGYYSNSAEFYDPSSDVWTLISNMPQSLTEHSAIEINGSFIVMGGRSGFFQTSKKVWALNTTDKNAKWIEKPSMSGTRSFFSIAKIHNKIFACGGVVGLGVPIDLVEIFDGGVWRDGPKMPARRCNAPAVVIPMEFARSLN